MLKPGSLVLAKTVDVPPTGGAFLLSGGGNTPWGVQQQAQTRMEQKMGRTVIVDLSSFTSFEFPGLDAVRVDRLSEVVLAPSRGRRSAQYLTGPFDIVGDIHGHLDELFVLMDSLGYDRDGSHRDGRTLVFVGDIVNKGPQSFEALLWATRAYLDGKILWVRGNHEALLRSLFTRDVLPHGDVYKGIKKWVDDNPKRSSTVTLKQMLDAEPSLVEDNLSDIMTALSSLPEFLVLDKGQLVVTHAWFDDSLLASDPDEVSFKDSRYCTFGPTLKGSDCEEEPSEVSWTSGLADHGPTILFGHVPHKEVTLYGSRAFCVDVGAHKHGRIAAFPWG